MLWGKLMTPGKKKPYSSVVSYEARPMIEVANGDWCVEGVNYDLGCVYYTLFNGPEAENRAKQYAEWQNELKQLEV